MFFLIFFVMIIVLIIQMEKNSDEKYAAQLSMLNTLLQENLLTPKEYDKVKGYLKQKYKVA